MKLFQYWDTPNPIQEIAKWIYDFKLLNPSLEHALFDRDSAYQMIFEHAGPREADAFSACAVPAMQADYFRLCAMDAFGGVYVDADTQCLEPLSSLIDDISDALLLSFDGVLNNGFMMVRQPGNLFIRAMLALATENIEQRRFDNAFTATGPGVLNAIRLLVDPASRADIETAFSRPPANEWGFWQLVSHAESSIGVTPELIDAYRSFDQLNVLSCLRWIGAEQPAYKRTSVHWLHWKGSLYR